MLQDLLKDHQLYMSEFQHESFVVTNSGGSTLFGQYKQALRELYKRTRGVRESVCNDKKLAVEIKILERDIKKETDELEQELLKIELVRKQAQQEESERVLKDTKREWESFYKQAIYLKGLLEKEHGELTDEVKKQLEIEMWHCTVKENIAMDYVTTGRISKGSYEMINSMPKDLKMTMLQEARKQTELVEWFENRDNFILNTKAIAQIAIPTEDLKMLT